MMLMRISIGIFVAAVLSSSGAMAQSCSAFTYTLTNGTSADASQVMSNFNTVRNCANTLASGGTLTNTTLSGDTTIAGGAINLSQSTATPPTPTAALQLAAGNVTAGTHVFAYSVLTATGETLPSPSTASVTADGTHQQVIISGLTGGENNYATGYKIYASTTGSTTLHLAATLSNPTQDAYTFNLADASFSSGAAPPSTNTTQDVELFLDLEALNIGPGGTATGPIGAIVISGSSNHASDGGGGIVIIRGGSSGTPSDEAYFGSSSIIDGTSDKSLSIQALNGDITLESTGKTNFKGGEVHTVRVWTAGSPVAVTAADFHVCINRSSAAATTVSLPASPAIGLSFTIDDCKGDANVHNITVTPAAGNIDGLSTYPINTSYGSWSGYYTGSIWKTTAVR